MFSIKKYQQVVNENIFDFPLPTIKYNDRSLAHFIYPGAAARGLCSSFDLCDKVLAKTLAPTDRRGRFLVRVPGQ
jgi:hypothetical protein